jgi:hypothetical protein
LAGRGGGGESNVRQSSTELPACLKTTTMNRYVGKDGSWAELLGRAGNSLSSIFFNFILSFLFTCFSVFEIRTNF